MYTLTNYGSILREDGVVIPVCVGNTDYDEYLRWTEAGNVAPHEGSTVTRESLMAEATAKRWDVETGGLTLPNGIQVLTRTEDQNRIGAALAGMEATGMANVDFKAASGWVKVELGDLQNIRAAIAFHVQACFARERAHHEAIEALADEDVPTYDVNTGWPQAGV